MSHMNTSVQQLIIHDTKKRFHGVVKFHSACIVGTSHKTQEDENLWSKEFCKIRPACLMQDQFVISYKHSRCCFTLITFSFEVITIPSFL